MKKSTPTRKIRDRKEPVTVKHIRQIDILKGLAIISVVLIHTWSDRILLAIGAPFHIWQAVPVFILLSAFTGTYALVTYGKKTLAQSYDISILIRRLKRILVPYLVIWICQILIIIYIILSKNPNIAVYTVNYFNSLGFDLILNFFSGGQGPGNYFIPVILQQILIVPVLYYLALKSPDKMLVAAFFLDLALEYLALIAGIPAGLFNILYIHFLFLGALGVWLVFRKDQVPRWLFIGGIASFAYIFAVGYLKFQFWFLYPPDSFFTAFAYFWTVLIVILGLKFIPSGSSHRLYTFLEQLGKASWHIFLVQMTLFFVFIPNIQFLFAGFTFLLVPFNLAACLSLGYGFYLAQRWASGRYGRKGTASP